MMALHVHLICAACVRWAWGVRISGRIFDLFFKDMDQAMREAGVGDMGVWQKGAENG